jgi:hypothetical protein
MRAFSQTRAFTLRYDAVTRALEIAPSRPFERFRSVISKLIEGAGSPAPSYGTSLKP